MLVMRGLTACYFAIFELAAANLQEFGRANKTQRGVLGFFSNYGRPVAAGRRRIMTFFARHAVTPLWLPDGPFSQLAPLGAVRRRPATQLIVF